VVTTVNESLSASGNTTRQSLRIAIARDRILEEQRKKEAAEAVVQAARAAAARAATAAAASSSSSQQTVKSAVERYGKDLRDDIYLTGCENILPLLGDLQTTGPKDNPQDTVKFNDLFPTSGEAKLTNVCKLVYGEILTGKIQARYGDARAFFLASGNDTQCNTVLRSLGGYVHTHCWICGLPLELVEGRPDIKDCEHRLNVLLALIFTGLYDGILHGILSRSQRGTEEYVNLLQFEYGWSHPVCNRLKRDLPFVKAVLGARTESGTLAIVQPNRAKIDGALRLIFNTASGYPLPSRDELSTAVTTTLQWDGNNKSVRMANPQPLETYLTSRPDVIAASFGEFLTKLNARQLTAKQLCLRVTRGLLLRACALVPALVRETIYNTLPTSYQTFVTDNLVASQSGTSRRKTRRNRMRGAGLRVQLLGGTDPLYDIVEYVVKLYSLPDFAERLATTIETGLGAELENQPDPVNAVQTLLDNAFDTFEQETAIVTAEATDRILLLLSFGKFATRDQFELVVTSVVRLTLDRTRSLEVDREAANVPSQTTALSTVVATTSAEETVKRYLRPKSMARVTREKAARTLRRVAERLSRGRRKVAPADSAGVGTLSLSADNDSAMGVDAQSPPADSAGVGTLSPRPADATMEDSPARSEPSTISRGRSAPTSPNQQKKVQQRSPGIRNLFGSLSSPFRRQIRGGGFEAGSRPAWL
jgi:hypothetical protein